MSNTKSKAPRTTILVTTTVVARSSATGDTRSWTPVLVLRTVQVGSVICAVETELQQWCTVKK